MTLELQHKMSFYYDIVSRHEYTTKECVIRFFTRPRVFNRLIRLQYDSIKVNSSLIIQLQMT